MSQVIAPRTISSVDEQPTFFDAGDETLFGILTRPRSSEPDAALIMVPSAERLGYRSRVGAMLAHRLAERGHQTFRFNYRGCGESTGKAGRFRLGDLFTSDAVGATAWLRGQGVRRFLYSGSCFGARTALAAAAEEPSTAGIVLVSMPLTNFAPGEHGRLITAGAAPRPSVARQALRPRTLRDLRNPEVRRFYKDAVRFKLRRMGNPSTVSEADKNEISPQMLGSLSSLVERRVPILFIYGEADGAYQEFLEGSKGAFGDLLQQAGDAVEVRVLPGMLHGWASIAAGEAAIGLMTEWVSRVDRPAQIA